MTALIFTGTSQERIGSPLERVIKSHQEKAFANTQHTIESVLRDELEGE